MELESLLASLPPYDKKQVFSLTAQLRDQGYAPELVAAALTQSRLRQKAHEKFGDFADGMMFTAAGRANVGSAGKGVAAAATCGYCGFLAGPPIIGFLSEHTGLAPAFLLLAGGCAIVATFALAAKPANHLGQD